MHSISAPYEGLALAPLSTVLADLFVATHGDAEDNGGDEEVHGNVTELHAPQGGQRRAQTSFRSPLPPTWYTRAEKKPATR